MTAITNRVLFSLWVPWKCGRWERGMFIAHHIMCHLKYSCNTQQGVLVLIWSSQCRGWNDVHVYGRRWCVTVFWMPCIHYKSPFDAVLLHLTFLVWFTLLFFGCVSEEFVFSKWDLKGQRESNTGTLSLSLLGEIIVCVVVSKLWIPILCCRFPRIVLQHCGLWSLRRTISEMKLPQDAGGLLFHLVLGSHSNTSSPSTSATWRMRVCFAFALVNLLLLEQTTGEEWTRSAPSNRPVEPAAVLSVGARRETLRLGSASHACLGFLLSKVGDGAWYFFISLWLRFKANWVIPNYGLKTLQTTQTDLSPEQIPHRNVFHTSRVLLIASRKDAVKRWSADVPLVGLWIKDLKRKEKAPLFLCDCIMLKTMIILRFTTDIVRQQLQCKKTSRPAAKNTNISDTCCTFTK